MLQLTLSGTPDLQAALDALDPGILPSAEEIEAILQKRLTKGHLTLEVQGPEAVIEEGDVVVLSIAGEKKKYNKARITVTVGQGLYSKELEPHMAGRKVGDEYADTAEGLPVQIRILEIKRKVVPALTDAMAADMHIDGVSTVEEYRAHLTQELTNYAVYPQVGQIMEDLKVQAKPSEPDPSVVSRLGDLEWNFFHEIFLKEKGIDLWALTPDELFEQVHAHNKEEFVEMRKDWYPEKAKMCATAAAALGVPLTGAVDPLEHYDALNNLQEMIADRIRQTLKGE